MLLSPPHHAQQIALGYCLPACAQMALAQFHIVVSQKDLAQVLGTRAGVGTPFSQIQRLTHWNVRVQLVQHASLDDLAASLSANMAVIAAVTTTSRLPGWRNVRTQHTVLVTSIGAEQVTYHDPAWASGPASASLAEFLLAWSEMDNRAALIGEK